MANLDFLVYLFSALCVIAAFITNKLYLIRILISISCLPFLFIINSVQIHLILFLCAIVIINVVRITYDYLNSELVFLTHIEKANYNNFFSKYLSPDEYKLLIKGSTQASYEDENVINEDEFNDTLYFVYNLSGEIKVIEGYKLITTIPNLSFLGEFTILNNSHKTSSSVHIKGRMHCILWKKNKLDKLRKAHPDVFIKLSLIISADLVNKLIRANYNLLQ